MTTETCPFCGAFAHRCNQDTEDGRAICSLTGMETTWPIPVGTKVHIVCGNRVIFPKATIEDHVIVFNRHNHEEYVLNTGTMTIHIIHISGRWNGGYLVMAGWKE